MIVILCKDVMIWSLCVLVLVVEITFVPAHEINAGFGKYAECGSGKVNYPIHSSNMRRVGREKRQARQPIRILPYFVTANISAGVLPRLQANDGPVMNALNYFQRTLSVEPFGQNIRAPSSVSMCGPHVLIPQDHTEPSGTGVDADYLYYVVSVNDETCQGGFIVAYAGPCIVLPAAGNIPIIGYVNVCPTALDRFSTDFIDTLLIHETMHALAFLRSLFERFPDHRNALQTQRIQGKDVLILTTPKVVLAARDHYNCSTLRGPLLENEGSELTQSSHWEIRVLFPEIMNGILYDQLASITVISRQTLSVFEDSGWYTVDYEAGVSQEKLLWGANEGCGFLTANCNSTSYPYSCTPCCDTSMQCAYDYQSAGLCTQATFFDHCAVVIPAQLCTNPTATVSIPIADLGPNSICVESTNRNTDSLANCIVHRCVQIQGTELMAFSLTINGQTEWCYTGGTVNNGQLQCPPLNYACARSTIDMLSPSNDPIPPPLCDPSCASCNVAQNPAFCLTCSTGRILNGNGPSTCLLDSNTCSGSTYLRSSGGCSACPSGCSLCNGPLNSDCLACEDTTFYRDTTNRLSAPCVTTCGSRTVPNEDVFGVRTCTQGAGGGGAEAFGGISSVYFTMIMVFGLVAVMFD